MKKYVGVYEGDRWPRVYVLEHGNKRSLKVNIRNPLDGGSSAHAWGYIGSMPKQLAWDLIIDAGLEDIDFDAVLDIVLNLRRGSNWELTEQEIRERVKQWHAAKQKSQL
ncbi:hypothetical protein [Candidatus Methylacidiphilum infernorum]|uniref:hypothetical protein n=1 Tax=Candidatus Methylacidiphilum infernorum TaxID=511746 RepID=UPI001EE53E97|nr:hypothetical protein [Candidatus Methylacidiphilum infernorum]